MTCRRMIDISCPRLSEHPVRYRHLSHALSISVEPWLYVCMHTASCVALHQYLYDTSNRTPPCAKPFLNQAGNGAARPAAEALEWEIARGDGVSGQQQGVVVPGYDGDGDGGAGALWVFAVDT